MKRQYQFSVLAIALLGTTLALAEGGYSIHLVDTCIGSLCLENKELTYQATKKMLGAGAIATVDKEKSDKKKLCYFDAQQKLSLLLEFDTHSNYRPAALETIFVTTEQICAKQIAPLSTLHELVTDSGIRIGMTEAELVRIKGQPIRIDDSVAREKNARFSFEDTLRATRFGEKVIVYLSKERVQFNFFYISDEKVKSILVSDAE